MLAEKSTRMCVRNTRRKHTRMLPQQWLLCTTAPGVRADDRRRLDVVIYGAAPNGSALCCDVTLVSPLTRTGGRQRSDVTRPPTAGGQRPHKLLVLISEVASSELSRFAGKRARGRRGGLLVPRSRVSGRICRGMPWEGVEAACAGSGG